MTAGAATSGSGGRNRLRLGLRRFQALAKQGNHGTCPGDQDTDGVVTGDQQDGPEEPGTGGSGSKGEHRGDGQIGGGTERAGPRAKRDRPWWLGLRELPHHGGAAGSGGQRFRGLDRIRAVDRELSLESAEHFVGIQPHALRVGADKRPPEDASGPARDVVGLEPFEQSDGYLRILGDGSECQTASFAFATQVGPERGGFGHQLRKVPFGTGLQRRVCANLFSHAS